MSLTIGRVELDCPYNITHDGDRLSFLVDVDGYLTGASVDVAKVFRQQLLGLVDNVDEPVVPITWSDDSDWDGFYRIDSVQIVPTEVYLTDGYVRHFSVSVSATAISNGRSTPAVELSAISGIRTNGVGLAAGDNPEAIVWWGLQDASAYGAPDAGGTGGTRTTADGVIRITTDAAPTGLLIGSQIVPASDFYKATVTLERQVAGSWYPVVGRQAPDDLAGNWRISNGIVRFSPSSTNVGDLRVECFDPDTSTWVDADTEWRYGSRSGTAFQQSNSEGGFFTGYNQAGATLEWVSPSIVRNSRDTVALRFDRSSGYAQTLTLHAADQIAFFSSTIGSFSHAVAARDTWYETSVASTGGFSYDPGLISSSADANGNKSILLYFDDTWTALSTGTTGGIGAGSARDTATFGIGVEISSASSSAPNTPQYLAWQYGCPKSWETVVSQR